MLLYLIVATELIRTRRAYFVYLNTDCMFDVNVRCTLEYTHYIYFIVTVSDSYVTF